MKKCAAFPGGALTDFWFPKRGDGGGPRARPPSPVALCARPGEGAIVFLHLSSCAMRWTMPVPIPTLLGHPQDANHPSLSFASAPCVRSCCLPSAEPSFTPWATARLKKNRPALTCWRIMLRSIPAKDGGGDRPVQEILDDLQEAENCRFCRRRSLRATHATCYRKFEADLKALYKSLQHQAQEVELTLTVKCG